MPKRHLILIATSVSGIIALILYIGSYLSRNPASASVPTIAAQATVEPGEWPLLYRHNGLDPHFGQIAYVQPGAPETAPRFIDGLSCEVVHASAGRGICLQADRGVLTTYTAKVFDLASYEVLATFPLSGIPSRTRVSTDGRHAASTVFVTGHSYASLDFSTQTLLIDVASGAVLADLETFAVTRDGHRFASPDFNFWGVTFAPDGRTIYATLSTNRQHFLVRADIQTRTAEVIHANVECPSLSPDGTRIAYKKRFQESGRVFWQLHVLALHDRTETPLAERRSVDDQLEWLDDRYVLYTVPENADESSPSTDVWQAAADGSGAPQLFLRRAYSPAVVRPRMSTEIRAIASTDALKKVARNRPFASTR